jgi:hypothetical protein
MGRCPNRPNENHHRRRRRRHDDFFFSSQFPALCPIFRERIFSSRNFFPKVIQMYS